MRSPGRTSPARFKYRLAAICALGVLAVGAAPRDLEADAADLTAAADPIAAADDDASCRLVQLDMTPTDDLQIVVWIEDRDGAYVDTVYITQLTGTYGMGNRPGMASFNSAYRWPYGRRTTTFPVWSHRHGMSWPLVVFQDGDDSDLSHPMGQSSPDAFYCRPIRESDEMWDTQTCATKPYTDKGTLSATETSRYPPRADILQTTRSDDDAVAMFDALNPFDAVSRATPLGGETFQIGWQIPDGLGEGEYVAWVEVSKEFDQNQHYDYPEPEGIPWAEFGAPYRGQPSVVYSLPFEISAEREVSVSTREYVGYGDPDSGDGIDGELRAPDTTITTDVAGSGASRLLLTVDGDDMFRVRVRSLPSVVDEELPGLPQEATVIDAYPTALMVEFMAPGDDGDLGTVAGYEVRYLAGEDITAENFEDAALAAVQLAPVAAGERQTIAIEDLLPRLDYSIGIRAYDECGNIGGLVVLDAQTPEFAGGTVDACFVATAAYGSLLQHDVDMLRRFRDRFLRTHITGELMVQSYYTFGPALAKLIAPSQTLRRAARAGLAPLVDGVRQLAPSR